MDDTASTSTTTLPGPASEQTRDAAAAPDTTEPAKRRVLMLTHRLPYPPDRGDRIRSYHLLKLLAERYDLAVACTSEEPVWLQHHQLLMTMANRVCIQPISSKFSKVKALVALAGGKAITPAYHYRVGLAETILQWHEEAPFDAVLTFCSSMVDYARLLTGPSVRAGDAGKAGVPLHVIDLVDVDSIKWANYAQHAWPPMRWVYGAEARRLRRVERGDYDHFDTITVVSQAEADAYRKHVGDNPVLIPVGNGVDLEYFHPLSDPANKTIVFVGVLNYKPNAEGITWFVNHVFSKLRKRVPDAQINIVGRHPTRQIEELGENAGVNVVGSVPDVREYMESASAVIAPLRIARGVQNKVLEAMACSKAVVCSPGAAEGIDAAHEQDLLVADRPEQWVDQLTRVLSDPALRKRLGEAGRRHVETEHSWESCLQPMLHALDGTPADTQ